MSSSIEQRTAAALLWIADIETAEERGENVTLEHLRDKGPEHYLAWSREAGRDPVNELSDDQQCALAFMAEEPKPGYIDYARIYLDNAGEWRYRVFAGNHRVIGKAEEGFASKSNAQRALTRRHPDVQYVTEDRT